MRKEFYVYLGKQFESSPKQSTQYSDSFQLGTYQK